LSAEELEPIARETQGKVSSSKKSVILNVSPEKVVEACSKVHALSGLYHLSTITGVDTGENIEISYHFWKGRTFTVVRTNVPKKDARISSITSAIPAAVLYEAEVKDLLGVVFEGNPFMKTKLLLPDDYPAEAPPPLRKEADPAKIRRMIGISSLQQSAPAVAIAAIIAKRAWPLSK
jgi:NADH:ubiquinone oxidoreductase subunit C